MEYKRKSKRAMFRTWFYGPGKALNAGRSPPTTPEHDIFASMSRRSLGQPPSQLYDTGDIAAGLAECMPVSKPRASSRRRLAELSVSLKNNLQRRPLRCSPDSSRADDTTLENMEPLSEGEDEPERLSCYRTFRSNALDLSLLFDNEINRSMGDLAIVNATGSEDVLTPVSPCKRAPQATSESSSVSSTMEDSHIVPDSNTPDSSPLDAQLFKDGKSLHSTLRRPVVPQRDDTATHECLGLYNLYDPSDASLEESAEEEESGEDEDCSSDCNLSHAFDVPSLVADSASCTSSVPCSDHSQTYTIPTFRKGSSPGTVKHWMASLREGSVAELSVNSQPSRAVSFRNRDFYDRLPNGYFDDPLLRSENFEAEDEEVKLPLPGSVRFNDESKLLVYTPRGKPRESPGSTEPATRSILKTKQHAGESLETQRALSCDTVDVQTFLRLFRSNEERRCHDERRNAASRERQLNRYYANGMALSGSHRL